MKTAIIGAEGFLGQPLLQAYRKSYPDCIGTTRHQGSKDLSFYDLSSPSIIQLQLKKTGHEAAIIVAALTKIENCEYDKNQAKKINVDGTFSLIQQLWDADILPIFFSSDHVFGKKSKQVFTEEDELSPVTEYGKSKANIETALKNSGRPHLIIRLGKVLGVEKGDGTLLDEIACLLVEGKPVHAAYDQILNPISLNEVVDTTREIQKAGIHGLVNMCSSESWTRYDLALAMAESLKCDKRLVRKISLDDLSYGFQLPKNVTLSNRRLRNLIRFNPSPVDDYIRKISMNWKVENPL
ncbi:MAG: sugar nucleotide-binding protein [Nitrospinae bacterium]|nr:sugar nucleotide-binding protein [Nitrospinota bacterium]